MQAMNKMAIGRNVSGNYWALTTTLTAVMEILFDLPSLDLEVEAQTKLTTCKLKISIG